MRLVAEKGRAGEIPEISKELDALVAQAQNRLAVELTTAYELSEKEAGSIVATIEKASGRTVEATRAVDPSLIGGLVLQIGSHRADGSVRGRLERLRHELAATMRDDHTAAAKRTPSGICARGFRVSGIRVRA